MTMKILIRDYEGERQECKKLKGKQLRKALFDNTILKLNQLKKTENKEEMYACVADLQEVYSTLLSNLMPKNPAAYHAVSEIGQKLGVDQGGYFQGYYKDIKKEDLH